MVAPAVALGLGSAAVSTGGALARLLRGRKRQSADDLRRASMQQARTAAVDAASRPGTSPALAQRLGAEAASRAAPRAAAQAAQLQSQETAANTGRRDRIVGALTGGIGQALSSAGGSLVGFSPEEGQSTMQQAGSLIGSAVQGDKQGMKEAASQVATGGLPRAAQQAAQPETGANLTAPQPQQQQQVQMAPAGPARPGNPLDVKLAELRGQNVGDLGPFLEQLRGQGKTMAPQRGSLQGGGLPGRRLQDLSDEELDAFLDALTGGQ